MNRLILKYGTPVTIVILAIFAWVIVRRIADGGTNAIFVLAVTALAVWVIGASVFISVWPRITVGGFKRVLLRRGLGGGPIPFDPGARRVDRELAAVTRRPASGGRVVVLT